jgi:seryl-tRNA synthetase
MRAFVEIRRVLLQQSDIKEQLRLIKERLSEHHVQLSQIYDSIENLLDDTAPARKWDERQRIGYRK